jgi:PAS domain S-box-containing protein
LPGGPDSISQNAYDSFALLESLFANASVGLAVLDRDLRFLCVNHQLAEWDGLPVVEHFGRPLRDVLPRIAPSIEPLFNGVLHSGEPIIDLELTLPQPDGGTGRVTWLLSGYPLRGAGGDLEGVGIVLIDLTERKREEERLRASLREEQAERRAAERLADRLNRLQSVTAALSRAATPGEVADVILGQGIPAVRASAGAVLLLSEDGTSLEVARQRGYPRDLAQEGSRFPASPGTPLGDAVQMGRPLWVSSPEEMERVYGPEVRGAMENPSVAVVPLRIDGHVMGVLGLSFAAEQTFQESDCAFMETLAGQCAHALRRAQLYEEARREIARREEAESALRVSEERHRVLVESGILAVAAFNIDGRFIEGNESFLRMIGFTAEEMAEGLARWDELTPPEGAERNRQAVEELRVWGRCRPYEKEFVRRDGSRSWALCCATMLNDAGEGVAYFVDVTERKRTEAEAAAENGRLNQRMEEAAALNRRMQAAVVEAHHRVKNSLQILSAMAEMQVDESSETVPSEALRRVSRHIRALATVHDILTRSARREEESQSLSAREALGKLLPLLEPMSRGRAMESEIADIPLTVKQSTSLAVLINELVSNAVKHGQGTIRVEFSAANGTADLSVLDEGPGFPAGFDSRKAAHMGLELIDGLAQWDLRGVASYENRPEGGGRVRIRFPLNP